jgi:hypothetical protein
MVISQPAFAFTNPSVTGSPTLSITTTETRSASINISSVPAGSCPRSALTRPAATPVSLTWETYWPAGAQQMSTGSGTAVSIPSGYNQWLTNDRIRVTMVYRYQCVYAGATAEICVRWFREFRANNNGSSAGWVLQGPLSTGPTVVSCSASMAAASRRAGTVEAAGGRSVDGALTD